MAFEYNILQDLAKASGATPHQFQVLRLSPGSVIVECIIHGDAEGRGHDAISIATTLEKQAGDPQSALRSGVLTRHLEALALPTLRPGSMQKLLATPLLTARADKTRGPEGSVGLVSNGVGMVIGRSDANDVTQPVKILKVAPGGSAHRSGNVGEGDELLAVDGLRCVGRTLSEISRHIIGPIGTFVEFEMKRSVQGPCWRIKLKRGGMEDAENKEEREKEDAAEEREKERIQNWAEKESIENWAKAMLKRKEQELHAEGGSRILTGSLHSNVVSLSFLHSDSEAEVEDVEDDERAPPPRMMKEHVEDDERAQPTRVPPRALFNPAQSYQENRVRDYQNHFPTAYSRKYVESAAGTGSSLRPHRLVA